jgi:hypothetical protein
MCSVAQAAVSGCGDAYAAGIGVSIANLTSASGLADVMTAAFSGALSVSQTMNDAAAVAQGVAIAFASQMGCEQSHSYMPVLDMQYPNQTCVPAPSNW